MPCILGCFALVAPRLTILLVVIFSDYLGQAYETMLWPVAGFGIGYVAGAIVEKVSRPQLAD